ncbi:ribosomal protein L17 [Infundibulicybe gibba]|nr:ribosomal protein L17 [Infundibulicybe gibba]
MKHGVAFRKFSRTSSHRMLMLRNLVTSLLEHEQIRTTLPKARDTARLAEKIITMGKKGDRAAQARASAFILKPSILPKLFGTFAERYAQRPGGYTRIHKFGNRKGDNAPQAILELVDNPRDLRWEITSRAIGWEMLKEKLKRSY